MKSLHNLVRLLDPTGTLPVAVQLNDDGQPDYDLLQWDSDDVPKPTREQFDEMVRQAVAMEYQDRRREAYPTVGEQLDVLFHGGLEEWRAMVQSVKDMYPKLES